MPELTLDETNRIISDFSRHEISFSDLADELIDHVCCEVECEMLGGSGFLEAYNKVLKKIGPGRFREIQAETLMATDFKYRNMKNMMKFSGLAGTIFIGLAATMKINHFPGAGIFITLGSLILSVLFLPSAMNVLWRETHNPRRLWALASGFITGAAYIASVLFKVQHWPGAGIIIMIAYLSSIFLLLPSLLVLKTGIAGDRRKRPVYYFGAVSGTLLLSGTLFKFMHWPFASVMMVTGIVSLILVVFPWYSYIEWKEEESVQPRFIFMVLAQMLLYIPFVLLNMNIQGSFYSGFDSEYARQRELNSAVEGGLGLPASQSADSSIYPTAGELHNKTLYAIGLFRKALSDNSLVTDSLSYQTELKESLVQLSDLLPEDTAPGKKSGIMTLLDPAAWFGSSAIPDSAAGPRNLTLSLQLAEAGVLAAGFAIEEELMKHRPAANTNTNE
jgi:hypothetical protein